jgi:hypothetical protein
MVGLIPILRGICHEGLTNHFANFPSPQGEGFLPSPKGTLKVAGMSKGRSTVSKAKSYKEIGDFWDAHDLSDFWDQTKKVDLKWISNLKSLTIPWIKSFPNKFSLLHRGAAYRLIRLLIYGFKRSFKSRTDESPLPFFSINKSVPSSNHI